MAKDSRSLDKDQTDFFHLLDQREFSQAVALEAPEAEGALNIDISIRSLVSEALKRTTLSRFQVAAEMSRLVGREISKSNLDSWSAESKEAHRIPLCYLPAFAKATGDRSIVAFICKKLSGHFIEGSDNLRLELGRVEQERRSLAKKQRAIRDLLGDH